MHRQFAKNFSSFLNFQIFLFQAFVSAIVFFQFPFNAHAGSTCENWFVELYLKKGDPYCEQKCAVAPFDMATFACPVECHKLCAPQSDIDLCKSPMAGQCDFYTKCTEKTYSCGSDGYPAGYGAPYCNRFLSLTDEDLSNEGLKWRDATLLCLQKELVKFKVPVTTPGVCEKIKKYAFESHADCYTQPGSSICDLPISDWAKISSVIKLGDLFSKEGVEQANAVFKKCREPLIAELALLHQNDVQLSGRINIVRVSKGQLARRRHEIIEKLRFIDEIKQEPFLQICSCRNLFRRS